MGMPEIKAVVNKEPERDKKKGGLLARLFGGGGSGGTAGLGGFGAAGSGGGLGGLAGGGLLATKAGLMALILVGTTVAGGIGMVGYRLFGPGADAASSGDNLQLFAPKPKDAQNADGQDGAKGDGNSQSLSMLSQGNATPKPADASASETPPADATAAGAAAAASAGTSGSGPINKAGDGSNGVNKGLLKNSGKFGALTTPGGGGGSGAVASSAPQKAPGADVGASKGSLSGFRKTAAATAGGTSRSLAGRHFGGAYQQGFGVLGNQKGAQSSYSAGQTYDGAPAGSNIGANGTPIGGAGDSSAGGAQPKSLPGPSTDQNTSKEVPTPKTHDAAPWADELKTAEILIATAVGLLLVASLINKTPTPATVWITRIIGGIVALIGAAVIAIGIHIANKYNQKMFEYMGLGVGAVLIALGANAMFTSNPPTAQATAVSGGATAASGAASGMAAANAAGSLSGAGSGAAAAGAATGAVH
jgi:hypothetical protein